MKMAGKNDPLIKMSVEASPPVEAIITGTIPADLKGSLLRVGPTKFEIGAYKMNHLFDGMAMVYSFSIENGKVQYQSRYIEGETYRRNMTSQSIRSTEFGTVAFPDPCKSIFSRYFSYFFGADVMTMTDNTCINLVPCQDVVFAISETKFWNKLDPETLETTESMIDMSRLVGVASPAHPHLDSEGNIYNFGTSYDGKPAYHLFKIPPRLEVITNEGSSSSGSARATAGGAPIEGAPQPEVLAKIQGQFKVFPSYYHSFGLSENYYILVEQPLLMNVWKLIICKLTRLSVREALEWYPEYKARFRLVNRKTNEEVAQLYTADPFFVFHHINAYEEERHLVIDLCGYHDASVIDCLCLKNLDPKNGTFADETLSGNALPQVRRYVLPLAPIDDGIPEKDDNLITLKRFRGLLEARYLPEDGSIHCGYVSYGQAGLDLPRINYDEYNGKKYRYAYLWGVFSGKHRYVNALIKMDMENEGEEKIWRGTETQYPSEPVFVPLSSAGRNEDSGVIMAAVTDVGEGKRDFLLILDAKTMEEMARAEVPPEATVPYGLHGIFT